MQVARPPEKTPRSVPALRARPYRRILRRCLGHRGFTLVEVAVVIVILSVIVFVAVPIVIQQSGRADPVRAAHDLASVRTAIDLFHLQTRTAFPRRLPDLITPITESTLGLDSLPYTASEVAGWDGPYLDPVLASSTSHIKTGSGVRIRNTFAFFDIDDNCGLTATNRAAAEFVAIRTLVIDAETFEEINDIVDGELEPDGFGPGLSMHTGRFRLNACPEPITTGEVTGEAYYLVFPY